MQKDIDRISLQLGDGGGIMKDIQGLIKRIRELPEPQQDMGEDYFIYEARRDEFNLTIDDVVRLIELYFKSR